MHLGEECMSIYYLYRTVSRQFKNAIGMAAYLSHIRKAFNCHNKLWTYESCLYASYPWNIKPSTG